MTTPEIGSLWRLKTRRSELDYRVEALGQIEYSIENGNKPEPCAILRPVLSGFELAQADVDGLVTWHITDLNEFEDVFEPSPNN